MIPVGLLKKNLVILGFCSLFVAKAQDKYCGTTEAQNKIIAKHPEVLQKKQELEQFTQQYSNSSKKTSGQVYIIPIVFHILHNYGPENISDEQVLDAVRILNEDFRKLNADITDVVPAFQGVAVDCEIEFRLAKKDPAGNCTNGIDRIATPLTTMGSDDAKLNQWPRDKYLNVWTVKALDPDEHPGAAGYSYYPYSTVWAPEIDGIILVSTYIGSIGTGANSSSRALTHEVGHWLNLAHPWGSTNSPGVQCNDDGVADTPITKGWTSCELTNTAICNAGIQENVQNYMEYSYCSRMYTSGQKSRMHSALNSSIADRNNLWTSANLLATGTDGSFDQVCAPQADFNADVKLACAGSDINFSDLSWNGTPTNWNWSFPGGTPSSSTSENPVIKYNSPGTYDITLVSGNVAGSGTKTKTAYITVQSNTADYSDGSYYDSFENTTFPNNDWNVLSPDAMGNNWEKTNTGATGNSSIMVDNYFEGNEGEVYEVISPSIDLSKFSTPKFYFKVANAQYGGSTDKLQVYISINCGKTWGNLFSKSGASLTTAGTVTSSFIPNASQWRQENINLAFYSSQTNVYFKFKFTSGGGNNIYLDDINIQGATGIDDIANTINFSVSPNPARENANVAFYLKEKQQVSIKLLDLLGKEINTTTQVFDSGDHQYTIQKDGTLAPGIYLVKLKVGETEVNQKIIFN